MPTYPTATTRHRKAKPTPIDILTKTAAELVAEFYPGSQPPTPEPTGNLPLFNIEGGEQ